MTGALVVTTHARAHEVIYVHGYTRYYMTSKEYFPCPSPAGMPVYPSKDQFKGKWAKLPSLGKKHQSRSRSVVIFGRRVATSTKVEAFCGADCIRLRAVAHSHGSAAPSPAAWTTICASGKAEIVLKTHLTSLN
ncbi:hypothetical protein OsJ_35925 [Oryza sativa Japonica Group]|uniref:Uncharacterized protein n=2 Tax=Oryza sativa subsp. japonica TaxID=39947 RepID=A0A8J8YR88_ORYSJ|nr:hypothetical protein LOC_Os12g24090 [Oryza sativa Japonica Group]EAZ20315.1 hypothetical protein OsJ_35925 [Oryza sativa Japonica Group]